jgi:hypothetical protein
MPHILFTICLLYKWFLVYPCDAVRVSHYTALKSAGLIHDKLERILKEVIMAYQGAIVTFSRKD